MKLLLSLSLLFLYQLFAVEFKVASYNVENLFDLKYDGTEYKEYKPHSKYWTKKAFLKKINNISKTINDLNADIIGLQEIESKSALNSLNKKLNYKYSIFIKNKHSSIGVGLLSKFQIKKFERIIVDKYDKYSRDILKVTINIDNNNLVIYVNHWRSKRAKESFRIKYAMALKNDFNKLNKDIDYIILGDLNSNYNEYQTFKYEKKLNNTYGITGINQVLNTTIDKNFVLKDNILDFHNSVHYNLWLDVDENNRFSSKFRTQYNTPDNILVPKSMFDNKGINYIENSFNIFKPNYLYNNNNVIRWNRYKSRGFSDHLPIYASFSTNNTTNKIKVRKSDSQSNNYKIKDLYSIEHIHKPLDIMNVVVIYRNNNIAIIKHDKSSRAIMIYKPPEGFDLGFRYNISVFNIDYYNGLKEIKKLTILNKLSFDKDYEDYIYSVETIDIFDKTNQNQMIKNLNGLYKNRYLYFSQNNKNKKIRVYFKKGFTKPKDNTNITIKRAQITIYKSKIQLTINSKDDFI
ncbi:MAG: endonuclease/exonuclease/phosphatase family protein [Campylobacterota bacterium]|nr:endonuclease/exonuclease/phosphatase family protein [Campylobacterota bacterium]